RTTPILMLTAQRETSDVVRGLDAGADDYLPKPFAVEELKARVRALTRRGGAARTDQVAVGNLVLNRQTKQVLVNGQRAGLTPKEYALLEDLVLHADEVVTRTQVLERVWERDRDPDSNVIDALVARLRAKLKELDATARIETVRGFGFMLTASYA
ncbi:MAG: winged helix-turn-helix domain-containing protein, partial [Gemmatimonadaceae bacterium]